MSKELRKVFEQQGHFRDIVADCPHCATRSAAFIMHGTVTFGELASNVSQHIICAGGCRVCGGLVVGHLEKGIIKGAIAGVARLIHPTGATWPDKAPANLDSEIKKDYDEARAVLPVSAQSAATLARRVLQHVLREKMNVKKANLEKEVEEACKSPQLSTPTKNALDHVRTIGNWGAHPKYDAANTLLRVEPGEAEYTLETIELLFHDLYDAPAKIEGMDNALRLKKQGQAKPEPTT